MNAALNQQKENQEDEIKKNIDDAIIQKVAQFFMYSKNGDSIQKYIHPKFISSLTKCIKLQKVNKDIIKSVIEDDNSNINQKDTDSKHKKFSKEEDEMLKRIVLKFGPKNWRLIASLMPGRTKRQCRDRYVNYLSPGFIRTQWSKEEDDLLAEKFILYGPKWAIIRQFFPQRTSNDIKNRFNYTVSRRFNSNNITRISQSKILKSVQNEKLSEEEIFQPNQDPFELFSDKFQVSDFDFVLFDD